MSSEVSPERKLWYNLGRRKGAKDERKYLFNLVKELGYLRVLNEIDIYELRQKEKPLPE